MKLPEISEIKERVIEAIEMSEETDDVRLHEVIDIVLNEYMKLSI